MFWKRFSKAQSANKLFNEASQHWRQRQRFLLDGDEDGAEQACIEVIKLCQLSIEKDERMGDAYVLLANALLSAVSQISAQENLEKHEFLHSRAAAVIHLWYSFPNRGYPITKNEAIGEQLCAIIVNQLMQDKALSRDDALALMESYKNGLAPDAVSPSGFQKIQEVIPKS